MNPGSLFLAGNQAGILSVLPPVLPRERTSTIQVTDSYEKTLREGKLPKG